MIPKHILSRWRQKKISTKMKPFASRLSRAEQGFIRRLPKAEIHLHFEGSILPATLLQLAQKYGDSLIRTSADAEWAFVFSTSQEFFEQFLRVSSFLRETDDFYLAAKEMAGRLLEDRIEYAEFMFSPMKFIRAGLDYAEMIAAIERGLLEGCQDSALDFRFIIDVVRDLGPEMGMEMLRIVEANPHPHVVGVGLGGGENYPPEDSEEVFAYAAGMGLSKTAHAGEGRGPQSIWGALRSLQVKRIDHGVRAVEDPELMRYLAENRITLNVCLTSNVMLGVASTYEAHPFRKLYEQGIPLTLSTDDPTFFQTTLCAEMEKLVHYGQLELERLPELSAQALWAAFLPEENKEAMRRTFQRESEAALEELKSHGVS